MHRRAVLTGLAAGAASAVIPRPVRAEDWPTRPVTLMVPFGAGGTTDATARLFAEHLSGALKQPIVVENRPGAQGNAGFEAAARAAPDGYTLVLSTSALVNNPLFGPKPRFDPFTAFKPIGRLNYAPNIVVARPGLEAATLQDAIRLAKRKPDDVTMGAGQIDMYMALLKKRAGAPFRLVPYRTSPQALTDAIAGHIDLAMSIVSTALPLLGEKLTPLAISARKRSPLLPNVPTYAESGVPDADVESWFGIAAPAGTPRPIVERVSAEVRRFVESGAVQKRFAGLALETAPPETPEEFQAFFRADYDRWAAIAKELDLKPE